MIWDLLRVENTFLIFLLWTHGTLCFNVPCDVHESFTDHGRLPLESTHPDLLSMLGAFFLSSCQCLGHGRCCPAVARCGLTFEQKLDPRWSKVRWLVPSWWNFCGGFDMCPKVDSLPWLSSELATSIASLCWITFQQRYMYCNVICPQEECTDGEELRWNPST